MSTASMSFGRPLRVTLPNTLSAFALASAALRRRLWQLGEWFDRPAQGPQTPQDVLAYALRIENSDPGFASDLRGAALRAMN